MNSENHDDWMKSFKDNMNHRQKQIRRRNIRMTAMFVVIAIIWFFIGYYFRDIQYWRLGY